jgi:hypothetical protein
MSIMTAADKQFDSVLHVNYVNYFACIWAYRLEYNVVLWIIWDGIVYDI